MPAPSASPLRLVASLRIEVPGHKDALIDGKKAGLLDAIARTKSISAAAKDQGISYRHAWVLVDDLNHAFLEPLVSSAFGGVGGGGTLLTKTGETVLSLFRHAQENAERASAASLSELTALLAPTPVESTTEERVHISQTPL